MRSGPLNIKRWFSRRHRLSAIEAAIFEALMKALPVSDASIVRSQMAGISKIQRLPDGVEVNFYMDDHGGMAAIKLGRLEGPAEFVLAKIQLEFVEFLARLDVEVWCVSGRVFAFEYKGSVNYYEEALGMDPAPELIIGVTLMDRNVAFVEPT